jgi:hypothetical protein
MKQLLVYAMKMQSNWSELTKQLNINIALHATCTEPSRENGLKDTEHKHVLKNTVTGA